MAMTPGRVPQKGSSPQRFTPKSSSSLPGKVRRALDGQIDSMQRNGRTIEVGTDGRLEVRPAAGGGIKMTKQGLALDPTQVGEKNRDPIARQSDLATSATLANTIAAVNALYAEMRRTGNMRG